jgi:Ras-related protein Rab-11A
MEFEIKEIPQNSEETNYNLKIVIVGDSGVGKSNIISRYCHDNFQQEGKATVGVELENKFYKINSHVLNVSIWDTAGQERFKSITNAYYRGANGVIVVFDLTRKESFENCKNWFSEVKGTNQNLSNLLLIGNKSDLKNLRQVTEEQGKEMACALSIKIYFYWKKIFIKC